MILLVVMIAIAGYGPSADPPFGSVRSSFTTAVLIGLAIWIARRGRRPSAAFASGLVISYTAQTLLESGAVRNILAGGSWVVATYLLCDRPARGDDPDSGDSTP
ncbi:MAG: hypothetical protein ACRDLN_17395 [Solirubrobacteraceae bacterium]